MLSSTLVCRAPRLPMSLVARSCTKQAIKSLLRHRGRRSITSEARVIENAPPPTLPESNRLISSHNSPSVGINATNDRLQALYDANKVNDAEQLFAQMQKVGPRPDSRTFSIMIKNYSRFGKVPLAEKLLQKMKRERDPAPTSIHFGQLITHWALVGNFLEIEHLIRDMTEYGVKVTPHIWSSSLVAYVRSELSMQLERPRTAEEWQPILEKAQEIFHQLVKQKALYANAYEVMIELHAKMGRYNDATRLYVEISEQQKLTSIFRLMATFFATLFRYREMESAGLKASKHTINNYIYCLGCLGDWRTASALAETLPAYSRAHDRLILAAAQLGDHRRVDQLVSTFAHADVAETQRYRLSFETTEAIIQMHLRNGDFERAEQYYQSTLLYPSKFSADLYNSLIQRYMSFNDLLRAEDTVEEMRAHSVLPNLETCATIIRLYGLLGRTAKAQRMFAETAARGFKLNTTCYNALMEALIESGRIADARAVYEELKSSKTLSIDAETVRLNIRLLGREGDPDSAYQVFEDMQLKYGFERTINHFNELLGAFAFNDRPDAVESVLFSGQGIQPNENTYVTLLDMLIRRDQYDRAARVFDFLRSRKSKSDDPDVLSFEKSAALINVFIRMLTRGGDYIMAEYSFQNDAMKPKNASASLLNVASSGMADAAVLVADVDTYAAMIECYANQSRVDDALKMLDAMKKEISSRRRVPSCYSLTLLMDLLGRSGRITDALSIWDEMTLKYRIIPDSLAYSVIVEACARNDGAGMQGVILATRAVHAASRGDLILRQDFAEAFKLLAQPRVAAKFQHRDEMRPLGIRLSKRRASFFSDEKENETQLNAKSEALTPQVLEGMRELIQSMKKLSRQ